MRQGKAVHLPAEELVRLIKADPDKWTPFALVYHAANGETVWLEKAKMGWWAMTHDEKESKDWSDLVVRAIQESPGKTAIALDCHI